MTDQNTNNTSKNTDNNNNNTTALIELLKKSVSPYHTVLAAEERLAADGFVRLSERGEWSLQAGGAYYVPMGGSTLVAFVLGEKWDGVQSLRMAAAHTDFPCFIIKKNPDIVCGGYQQLNVEVYGGPILNTWLDRPLSAAGQVVLKSEDPWNPQVRYVDLERPFCLIPNLAVHMNRQINKGVELNRQTELLPIAGLAGETQHVSVFEGFLAEKMGVKPDEILDYSLYLYATERPERVGMRQELLSACHLDNTTGVEALLAGMSACAELARQNAGTAGTTDVERTMDATRAVDVYPLSGIRLAAFFDHEEIGSRSKQGAASMLLRSVLGKIGRTQSLSGGFWQGTPDVDQLLEDAMLLSVDVAHGSHPNYMGKMDLTNRPVLGGGFCIKKASSQSYATDSVAIGILQQLCEKYQIPWQTFMNRSDEPGGSTLGAVGSGFLPIPTVDLGVPLLAMHSARELMAEADMQALCDCVTAFLTDETK